MTTADEEFPDSIDLDILARLKSVYETVDPPPPMLDDLTLFAIAPARVEQELARIVTEDEGQLATRSSASLRSVEFQAGELTIILTISPLAGDQVRLDGWLVPAAEVNIEIRVFDSPVRSEIVSTDNSGRFSVPELNRNRIQLVIATDPPIVTPATQL